MAERSGVALTFEAGRLPLYDGARAAAQAGIRTGGDARNRAHLETHVTSSADAALEALAYDPQTSGGLLASVTRSAAAALVSDGFVEIGEVTGGPARGTLSR
jgi:selenide,water dikinase